MLILIQIEIRAKFGSHSDNLPLHKLNKNKIFINIIILILNKKYFIYLYFLIKSTNYLNFFMFLLFMVCRDTWLKITNKLRGRSTCLLVGASCPH